MAEVITGDTTKGIKSVGELALRISKFDSYRLFTLYENVKERKVMDVSGGQKYYLVFKSPKKEIRIPEYDTNGYFEVDKVNGCILFKITKKNAEDILSMKTAGEKIFHIVRVFEERDEFGKVLNITDEVEVYNGKWGDDSDFSTYSTENKVDLLTKSLATQVDRNGKLLNEYANLQEMYNAEIEKTSNLEKEVEALRLERDSLETQLNEYMGNTYDGTLLSTDTKYIAFENTLDNVSFTEEQFNTAMNDLMTKNEFNLSSLDLDVSTITLNVLVNDNVSDLKIIVYKNDISIGVATYDQGLNKTVEIEEGDKFEFKCMGTVTGMTRTMMLSYDGNKYTIGNVEKDGAQISKESVKLNPSSNTTSVNTSLTATIISGTDSEPIELIANIGSIKCYIGV